MKKKLIIVSAVLLLLITFAACRFNIKFNTDTTKQTTTTTKAPEVKATLNGPYDVVRVVDGDTIIIDLDGQRTKVRLSNVDTPESVASEESGKENTPEGVIASDYTKNLLPEGSKVYLEYDNKTTDQYDRVLAYVYLEDGETMIQRLLLKDGMARVFNDKINKRYTDEFFDLQDAAKDAKIGIWAGE